MDKTNECALCGRQNDSRVQMLSHLKNAHTLQERIDGLILREVPAEDTYA